MLRLKNLANKYQKRTCRPVYANTQATPYAATLHATTDGNYGFRKSTGALQVPPLKNGTAVIPATAENIVNGTLLPGTVMARIIGTEQVTIATGATDEQPFGLLANFVGGDMDEGFAGDSLQNQVGVWRGPGSVFEVLAPAFGTVAVTVGDSTGTTTTDNFASGGTTANSATGAGVLLYADTKGRLTTDISTTAGTNAAGKAKPVARLIEKVGSSRIVVDLLV